MRAVQTTSGRFSALAAANCCPECAKPSLALGSLGRLFCSELDLVVDALQASLREVVRVRGDAAAKTNPTAQATVAFINRYKDGVFTAPIIGTETCRNLITQGQALANAMNSLATGSTAEQIFGGGPGGTATPVPGGEISSGGGIMDALGSIKTIAIAGAVIAGVVLLAPVVFEFVGARRLARKGK